MSWWASTGQTTRRHTPSNRRPWGTSSATGAWSFSLRLRDANSAIGRSVNTFVAPATYSTTTLAKGSSIASFAASVKLVAVKTFSTAMRAKLAFRSRLKGTICTIQAQRFVSLAHAAWKKWAWRWRWDADTKCIENASINSHWQTKRVHCAKPLIEGEAGLKCSKQIACEVLSTKLRYMKSLQW